MVHIKSILLEKVMRLEWYSASVVSISVWFESFLLISIVLIVLHTYMRQCYTSRKMTGLILYPYLPTTATSLQWPLSSVLKVTAVERFNWAIVQRFKMYL